MRLPLPHDRYKSAKVELSLTFALFESGENRVAIVQIASCPVRWGYAKLPFPPSTETPCGIYSACRPTSLARVCGYVYPAHLSALAPLMSGRHSDPRATHSDQSVAHGGGAGRRASFQLPPRLFPPPLDAVGTEPRVG